MTESRMSMRGNHPAGSNSVLNKIPPHLGFFVGIMIPLGMLVFIAMFAPAPHDTEITIAEVEGQFVLDTNGYRWQIEGLDVFAEDRLVPGRSIQIRYFTASDSDPSIEGFNQATFVAWRD